MCGPGAVGGSGVDEFIVDQPLGQGRLADAGVTYYEDLGIGVEGLSGGKGRRQAFGGQALYIPDADDAVGGCSHDRLVVAVPGDGDDFGGVTFQLIETGAVVRLPDTDGPVVGA